MTTQLTTATKQHVALTENITQIQRDQDIMRVNREEEQAQQNQELDKYKREIDTKNAKIAEIEKVQRSMWGVTLCYRHMA